MAENDAERIVALVNELKEVRSQRAAWRTKKRGAKPLTFISPADWINAPPPGRPPDEQGLTDQIRAFGDAANKAGGFAGMSRLYQAVREASSDQIASTLDHVWSGIGRWQA